jgi:predicted dehydrogenase
VKILSFGFGSIAQRHISNLASIYNVELLVVFLPFSSGPLKCRPHYKQQYFPVHRVDSLDELRSILPTLCSTDLILIASPSIFHVDQLLFALSFVLNTDSPRIIVEKPLATCSSQLQLLVGEIQVQNPNIYVISQYRANPVYGQLLDIIHRGELGALRFASINTHEAIALWHPWENYRESYAVNQNLGGGCLLTQMHDLEIVTALVGIPSNTDIRRGTGSRLQIDCDDYYSLSMSGFNSSSICNINIQVSYYCNTPLRDYLFIFDDGVVHADFLSSSYTLKQGGDIRSYSLNSCRNAMYESIAEAAFSTSPSPRSGLVPIMESLGFHAWLCSLSSHS